MLRNTIKWEHNSIEVLGVYMYFYIKPINHHTYYNREALALVKNLQSLGVGATGNLGIDRANLQKAEYEKLKQTLSPSQEQNIQNAKVSFDSIMQDSSTQVQQTNIEAIQKNVSMQNSNEITNAAKEKIGATQLAELNKYILGFAA